MLGVVAKMIVHELGHWLGVDGHIIQQVNPQPPAGDPSWLGFHLDQINALTGLNRTSK